VGEAAFLDSVGADGLLSLFGAADDDEESPDDEDDDEEDDPDDPDSDFCPARESLR
jgi:hypothetical protein